MRLRKARFWPGARLPFPKSTSSLFPFMLPKISQATQLATYRDGGSMSVSFKGEGNAEFTLMLRVMLDGSVKQSEKRGYASPKLQRYRPFERVSPVTGLVSTDWYNETITLTWHEARVLLERIGPFLDGLVSDFLYVYPQMVDIAKREGRSGNL